MKTSRTRLPIKNHELPQTRGKERVDLQQKYFQPKEITALHAVALATEHTKTADLILLGANIGARIEEICQLKVEHLIKPDGIESFDIVDLKTAAGIRAMPLHPSLIRTVEHLRRWHPCSLPRLWR